MFIGCVMSGTQYFAPMQYTNAFTLMNIWEMTTMDFSGPSKGERIYIPETCRLLVELFSTVHQFQFNELKLVCVSPLKGTIVYFRPMLFRFESLLNNDNHTNLDHAFTVANEEFSVPKLLEPGGKGSPLCLRPCHFDHFGPGCSKAD